MQYIDWLVLIRLLILVYPYIVSHMDAHMSELQTYAFLFAVFLMYGFMYMSTRGYHQQNLS